MTHAVLAFLGWLAGCAPVAEPLPEGSGMVLEDVVADGAGWRLVAPRVALAADTPRTARVAQPALRVDGAAGAPAWYVTAAESTWDLRGRAARFVGDVEVRRGDLRLRCRSLEARWREAAGGPVLDAMDAEGPVELSLATRTARADRAVLRPDAGVLDLRGAVRLSLDGGTMEGLEVTLHLDDARVACRGAAGAPCRVTLAAR
jgi:lipopolysaccharide export system protein LptA